MDIKESLLDPKGMHDEFMWDFGAGFTRRLVIVKEEYPHGESPTEGHDFNMMCETMADLGKAKPDEAFKMISLLLDALAQATVEQTLRNNARLLQYFDSLPKNTK